MNRGRNGINRRAITSLTAAATALKHTNHSKDTKMQEAVKEWDEWDVDFLVTKPSKGDFTNVEGLTKIPSKSM